MKTPFLKLTVAALLSMPAALVAQAPAEPVPPGQPSKEEAESRAKVANLDKMPGYGGVAFGSPFPEKDYELEQDRGALKIYRKGDEKTLIGPALIDDVLFHVFQGKFYGVAFHTADGQDSMALKGIFINAFGCGVDSDDNGPSTIWIGKERGALFDLNTATGQSSAFIFDLKLHNACLAEQSQASQSAAQQLIQGKP